MATETKPAEKPKVDKAALEVQHEIKERQIKTNEIVKK
jgi:hypothetical protein